MLAVDKAANRVGGLCGFTETDPRAGRIEQFQMPGYEVGMEVGVDHTLDGQAQALCVVKIFGDVTARVDYDCAASAFVADQVRRMRQALDVVLLENHRVFLHGVDFSGLAMDSLAYTP